MKKVWQALPTPIVAFGVRDVETIDAANGIRFGLLGIESRRGIVDFHHDRIFFRNGIVEIAQHQVDLQFIARTPNATVGVGKASHTFFNGFTANIKLTV